MNTDTTGTLGQLTVIELLDTASHEVSGLTAKVETLTLPDDDRLIVEAYLGSIGARIAVARDKLDDIVGTVPR